MPKLFCSNVKVKSLASIERGDYSQIDDLIKEFYPYMKSKHGKKFRGRRVVDLDDFKQECSTEIIKSIPYFRKSSVGELCNFIITIIDRTAIRMVDEYIEYGNYHIYVEETHDDYYSEIAYFKDGFEEEIVNNISRHESYRKFIKGKITRSEEKVMEALLHNGGDIIASIKKTKMKSGNFKRTLLRARKNINPIVVSEEFRKYHHYLVLIITTLSQEIIEENLFILNNLQI